MNKSVDSGGFVLPLIVGLVYLFLYIPILVLIAFSFSENGISFNWDTVSFRWYYELYHSEEIWRACYNSFIVAMSSVMLSALMGTLFVFFGVGTFLKKLLPIFFIGIVIPEIIMAVGLLSLFAFFSVPLGITTLISGHTLIGLSYVIPVVQDRYDEMDHRMIEASMDLGASKWQTFRLIVIPFLKPAILSASLLVFILSFDDFIVSFFCAGTGAQTLSLYIFASIRSGVSPVVNALSTVVILFISLLVLVYSYLTIKSENYESIDK